ncbi:LOW QUALITY PROTEIN: cytoplasmic tyrosine-protein kinase BMX [Phaethornis superciliosus]
MEKKAILEELVLKKPQQKKKISPINYKKRLFILTKATLSYYEYDKGIRNNFLITGFLAAYSHRAGFPNLFQIVYKGGLLYVYSLDEESWEQWLAALHKEIKDNSDLLSKYHERFFIKEKFLCCSQTCKAAPGCTIREKYVTLCCTTGSVTPLPPVPTTLNDRIIELSRQVLNMAVAQCDYEAKGNQLVRSNKYYVLQEEYSDWWKIRDLEGNEVFVPSTYLRKLSFKDDEPSVNERILAEEQSIAEHDPVLFAPLWLFLQGKEGAFMVWNSSQAGKYTVYVFSKASESKKGTVRHYHVHKMPESQYYLAENYCFESISKLIVFFVVMVTRLQYTVSTQVNKVPSTASLGNGTEMKQEEIVLVRAGMVFGMVYLGKWKGQYDVAIKLTKKEEGAMPEDEFIEEAQTTIKHAKLRLYGVCSESCPTYLVKEYMPNGCLLSYRSHGKELQPLQLLEICYNACDAMALLQRCQFIHRDLLPEKHPTFHQLSSFFEALREDNRS